MRNLVWSSIVMALGCTSVAPSTGAGRCSTGAPYETTLDLPFVTTPSSGDALPDCTPRCGAVRAPDGFFGIDALPRGSCADPTCRLGARERCSDETVTGPVTTFRCECSGGVWTCGVLGRGMSTCAGVVDSGVSAVDADGQ